MLGIALLLWLWVIEKRLHGLQESIRSLRLDVDGLRAVRLVESNTEAKKANADATPPLPDVTTLAGPGRKTA